MDGVPPVDEASDQTVIAFPGTARRIAGAEGRLAPQGGQLVGDVASLARSASALWAMAAGLERTVGQLDRLQDALAEGKARMQWIAAESARIEQMVADGEMDKAAEAVKALAHVIAR